MQDERPKSSSKRTSGGGPFSGPERAAGTVEKLGEEAPGALSAGLLAQGFRDLAFSDSGGTGDQDVLVFLNPGAIWPEKE